ncbi:MAG: hypothetical protein OWT28_09945 [Firmicutes bacterium]|nr:hypothetical protein [Bacillota bacterium]
MTPLFAVAVALAYTGYLIHWPGLTVIGTGAATVLWWGAAGDTALVDLASRLRLEWQRHHLQFAFRLDEREIERARQTCRTFLRRYPHHVRVPFALTEEGRVVIRCMGCKSCRDFAMSAIPAPYLDLQTIMAKNGIHFTHPLLPILLLNQEVRRGIRLRLQDEVVQAIAVDSEDQWGRLWLRFALWERERQAQEGGKSLLYREELANYIVEQLSEQLVRRLPRLSDRSLTRLIDKGIAQAEEQLLRRQRAMKLEAFMRTTNEGVATAKKDEDQAAEADLDWAVTATQLAAQFEASPERVTGWLCKVFTGTDDQKAQKREASTLGYFLADSGVERIVFQVGWRSGDYVSASAIERAYTARSRENAQRCVVLALGPVSPDVYMDADELGVLVLPVEALDRLLTYHADRMWQTIEWSLRASSKATLRDGDKNVHDDFAQVLELGLST